MLGAVLRNSFLKGASGYNKENLLRLYDANYSGDEFKEGIYLGIRRDTYRIAKLIQKEEKYE
ncbi:MAG: hypothetical protein HP024_04640, partial [Acholeplasmatales bacterium]|nr:hypothetical protein [Acholeplasmatales bacterium]